MTGERLQIIYRNYATLYFVFVVDSSESELGILDLIQVLDSLHFGPEFARVHLWGDSIIYRCLWNPWTGLSKTFANWTWFSTLMM